MFNSISVVSSPIPQSKAANLQIYSFCQNNNIKFWEAPPKSLTGWNLPGKFDFGIVISFGYFIPRRILECLPLGIVNVHPSKLPSLRGPAPMIHALANGDKEGGISIIELHPERFDAGRILKQSSFDIPSVWNYSNLEDAMVNVGVCDLVTVMEEFQRFANNSLCQNERLATHAPKIDRSFAAVSFSAMTKRQIIDRYRAIQHLFPLDATFVLSGGNQLQIKIVKIDFFAQFSPSEKYTARIFYSKRLKLLFAKCACGNWLGVSTMRVAGKCLLYSAGSFTCGYQFDSDSYFM